MGILHPCLKSLFFVLLVVHPIQQLQFSFPFIREREVLNMPIAEGYAMRRPGKFHCFCDRLITQHVGHHTHRIFVGRVSMQSRQHMLNGERYPLNDERIKLQVADLKGGETVAPWDHVS